MKALMYAHGGSGNHGCEAIVRSTVNMLSDLVAEKPLLVTSAMNEDKLYGLEDLCTLINDISEIRKNGLDFLKAYISLKIKSNATAMDALLYKNGIQCANKGDIALSIGGDNYCYKNYNHYIMLHNEYKKRGAKTVLWGCSVEPSLLNNKEIAYDLSRYDLITAREPYSYEALRRINPNTVKVSDPAFTLNKKDVSLPQSFVKGNTVGINISPMVIENEKITGMAFNNYLELCRYILRETDMSIALIPHVVWADGDDRIPLKALYNELDSKDRVCIIDDCDCEALKGYIASCRFFVASRTHASIAAYSSCVPTLVVGYSIKARGIAIDLFGEEDNYVLPVQSLSERIALTNAFVTLAANENNVRSVLVEKMPKYKDLALKGTQALLAQRG